MVAISTLAEHLPTGTAGAEGALADVVALPVGRPQLRLLQGGLADEARPSPSTYRRRRLAALVLAVALVVGAAAGLMAARSALAGSAGSGPLTAPAAASSGGADLVAPTVVPPGATTVVVGPGDTLWSIARQVTPAGGDVAGTVERLVARNGGLTQLVPGMTLALD